MTHVNPITTPKIKVAVSSCLLGNNVRYNGKLKSNPIIIEKLGPFFEWLPVCPEVEMGSPVPREAVQLRKHPSDPALIEINTEKDLTSVYKLYESKRIKQLGNELICGYIFKNNSPSCSLKTITVYNANQQPIGSSPGLFARQVLTLFPKLPLADEEMLQDGNMRDHFLKAVRLFHKQQGYPFIS